jgi:hypothetical protein
VKLGAVILAWIARNAFALILIVLMLLAARYVAPPAGEWFADQWRIVRTASVQKAAYAEAARDLEVYGARRRAEADGWGAALARSTEAQLHRQRATVAPRIARQEASRLSPAQLAVAAARGDSKAIFGHYRAEMEVALLAQERDHLDALLSARAAQREGLRLQAQRRAALEHLSSSHNDWLTARRTYERLQARFMAGPRNAFCRASPLDLGCDNYRALRAARRAMDVAAAQNRAARTRLARIAQAEKGRIRADAAFEGAGNVVRQQQAALADDIEQLDRTVRSSPLLKASRIVADVLPTALLILGLALVSPLLIKTILFYGVAPLAEGRPPIRLTDADEGRASMLAGSAVSQRIHLQPGEALLVRPDALQSTPHHAATRTRWLLDWTMPLSSVASGMVALTLIEVEQPDTILVSATGGPLMEIALIRLERGSALVLRPRALRGLLQSASEPVRITRRWRFGVSAWLTLQFRYLILHGPCTLVVEGARGVRLEEAGSGRGINQAAMIGFSAGLAYGVARTETFGAYLLGTQALFNDSFSSADGVHLHEEMPLEMRRGGVWRGGLRGLGDAALRVVGL